jgi:uncharacterized protein YecT (DUF1311 family)
MKKFLSIAVMATTMSFAGTGLNCSEIAKMKANEVEVCVTQTDDMLNGFYKELMSDDMFKKMPRNKKALKDAQKTWLKFRDASCNLILTLGTAASNKEEMMNNCLVKTTMQRNDELESLIEEYIAH